MSDKVIGGTPKTGSSLCLTCRNAHVLRGQNFEHHIFCNVAVTTAEINFPVSFCSVYDDKRIPSLGEMKQIAWNIKSRTSVPAGFTGSKQTTEIVITPPRQRFEPSGEPGPDIFEEK